MGLILLLIHWILQRRHASMMINPTYLSLEGTTCTRKFSVLAKNYIFACVLRQMILYQYFKSLFLFDQYSWGKWFCTNILNNSFYLINILNQYFYLIKIHLNWLLSFHWLPVSGTRGQLSGLDWIWNTKCYATSLWCIKEKWKIKSGAKVDVLTCWGHCAKMMRGSLTMETIWSNIIHWQHSFKYWLVTW